ncbi:MAG TPA: radical SAM protein [Flavilitoribacter sp.]|nr:radical SAM protein [Flavilitoribacter sp.]HMQ86854.1 radical SAM protein [Flavilitoribacter sp.]
MPNEIQVKTVLNKTKRRDPWFLDDYTVNPYSGCSFNCLYCYIRGSKYGAHMEEKLGIKVNSPEILEKNLAARAKKGQYGIVVLSSATDPYLHFEKEYQLTRRFLELFLKYRFPVHVITKSDLVIRDFDLLKEIETNAVLPAELEGKLSRKVFVTFSFSTLDDRVSAIFEPGATPPSIRLETLKTSLAAGFHSGVSLMPLLPWISDKGDILEETYRTFSEIGVNYLFPATLTLFGNDPSDSKPLVLRAVAKHYPELLEKYQRFFDQSTEMPARYRDAFHLKTRELAHKYHIRDRII